VLLPGPELGADEEDDGDAEAVELLGEGEVDVWEVDEDGEIWLAATDGGFELAELGVDAGQVADDFRDAHDGDVFRTDDAVKACFYHARTAHAYETQLGGGLLAEGFHQHCTVVLAAGFACRDEKGGGHGADDRLQVTGEGGQVTADIGVSGHS
jgi:hypothetical protein